jgi:phosphonate transport system substrate-binding protein
MNRNLTKTLALALAGSTALTAPATAQEAACADVGELVIAIVPAENAQGTLDRFTPMADYLSEVLGTPTVLRIASDYAAVIEGHNAGNIHIGWHGPGSYARAYQVTGGQVEAFATPVASDGTIGYYSVVYAPADAPFDNIQEAEGQRFGLVDPNSTSGNFALRFFLEREGINVEEFFSDVVYTGSHENAVIAIDQGVVDLAGNWWNSDTESNLMQMQERGLVDADDFKIVWTSPLLAAAPFAYVSSLSDACKADINDAFLTFHEADPEAFEIFSSESPGFAEVSHEDYVDSIEMIAYVDQQRRQQQ